MKNLIGTKRRKICACVTLTVLYGMIYLSYLKLDLYFMYWGPYENTSCHYTTADDALPSAESDAFRPPRNSIFFHETSCKGNLDSRQACAVESASKAHPDWQIYVLFSSPVTHFTLNSGSIDALRKLSVKFARVHVTYYAKNTPLESLVSGGALNRTRWRTSHTSDVLRYLTLYKWGGVYLDLDVVVARNLEGLAMNWAARETDLNVAAGALSFSRDRIGRNFAESAIRDIRRSYRGDVWGNNGPGVITRVLKDKCSTKEVAAMSASTCNGFEVYGPHLFYPIEYTKGRVYFDTGDLKVPDAYIYHVWNHLTHHLKVMKGSPYETLAKRFCPTIYKMYGDNFGS